MPNLNQGAKLALKKVEPANLHLVYYVLIVESDSTPKGHPKVPLEEQPIMITE